MASEVGVISGNDYGDVDMDSGLSVFCIDPGETTGWVWILLAPGEFDAVSSGDRDRIDSIRRAKGGFQLADRRYQYGQIDSHQYYSLGGRTRAEIAACETILVEVERCKHLAERWSKGKVGISVIIIEDFILRQRTKSRNLLAPVRFAARIETMVHENRHLNVPVILQTPSDALGVMTDARMKAMGLYLPGQPHATDASRHLMLALRRLVPLWQGKKSRRHKAIP